MLFIRRAGIFHTSEIGVYMTVTINSNTIISMSSNSFITYNIIVALTAMLKKKVPYIVVKCHIPLIFRSEFSHAACLQEILFVNIWGSSNSVLHITDRLQHLSALKNRFHLFQYIAVALRKMP